MNTLNNNTETVATQAAPEATQAAPEVTQDAVIKELMKQDDILTFVTKFKETLNNEEFLTDEAWISRATNGLDKPKLEDRMESQAETNVRKELRDKAGEIADAGGDYVPVTQAAIDAAVKLRLAKRNKEVEQKKQLRLARAREAARAGLSNA